KWPYITRDRHILTLNGPLDQKSKYLKSTTSLPNLETVFILSSSWPFLLGAVHFVKINLKVLDVGPLDQKSKYLKSTTSLPNLETVFILSISSVEETGRVIVEADDVDYSDDNESNNAMIVSPDDNDGINDGNADGSRSDVN
ncbi:10669_t:CDS:2, partial [Entrophospora sp. SA101]